MAELASKFNVRCVIQYYSDQWSDRDGPSYLDGF